MDLTEFNLKLNSTSMERTVFDEINDKAQKLCLEIFEPEFFHKWYPLTKCELDLFEQTRTVSQIVKQDETLQILAKMIYFGVFKKNDAPINFSPFNYVKEHLEEKEGIYYLLIALGALPLIEEAFSKRNIPVKYAHDIAAWLAGAIEIYQLGHNNTPGFNLQQLYWMRFYINCELFRIGRLEYLVHNFNQPHNQLPAIYSHKETGELMVFSPSDWHINNEGKLSAVSNKETITATLEIDNQHITGTPIDCNGKIIPGKIVAIDTKHWEPVCSPWDLIPSIHIPGGRGMNPELVKSSMVEACEFFRTYFHQEVKMFFCNSWILNPEWENIMPNSNLVKFMHEGYRFPTVSTGKEGLFFIYGKDNINPLEVEPANKMQSFFKKLLLQRKSLQGGGVFFLSRYLNEYGTQFYRKTK